MKLPSLKLTKTNTPRVIFFILLGLLVVVVAVACVNQYYKVKAADRQRLESAQAARAKSNKIETQHNADRQASITRLVSICRETQEQYDKLSAKDRIGKTRPNCTIIE